ncbi:MAG: hypothetical protein J5546_00675 [Lachnospiraceae bacterium]|nr:hypothetical protein [Lachnospiraceae bacterium]
MNLRCPGCGATAEYSPEKLKMVCEHCGNIFSISDMAGKAAYKKWAESDTDADKAEMRKHATIKMRHFHCSACGAELLAKETEATSFCFYCGQPAVMEEQLSDYLEPDYIIPFQITQEEAAEILHKRFRRGFFVPRRFKRFKVERLTPIYVPYWLIDMEYENMQFWKYKEKKDKYTSEEKYVRVGGSIHLDKYSVDASQKLEDLAGQRIGPFDRAGMKPFDAAYLSGYYADRFDVGEKDVESFAIANANELFDWEMQKKVLRLSPNLFRSNPKCKILSTQYALCPVWFLNVTMKDRVYTMLVNGQTGKVVFALPPAKLKMALGYLLILALLAISAGIVCFVPILMTLVNGYDSSKEVALFILFALIAGLGSAGFKLFDLGLRKADDYLRDIVRINGENNVLYVKDRGTDAFQG